jgi:(2Fe-2S) ferredoxin
MKPIELKPARRKCDKLGLGEAQRTLLVCMDRKTAKCADSKQMLESWKHLKQQLKELKLDRRGAVVRIKMGCPGICKGGPIMAVMPDNVWYGSCTPEVIDRILREHLIAGQPVEEFVIS